MIRSVDVYWNTENKRGHSTIKCNEVVTQDGVILLYQDRQLVTIVSPTQFLWMDVNR
jgi:hypothetical protein